MSKNIGGNQRVNRQSKLIRLIGAKVLATFILPGNEKVIISDDVEKRGSPIQGYFLKNFDIQLSLKYIKFEGYEAKLTINVPEGSYIKKQLENYVQEQSSELGALE